MIGSGLIVALAVACLGDEAAEEESRLQQGTWQVVSSVREDKEAPADIMSQITRTVEGDHVIWHRSGRPFGGTTLVLDPTQEPKALDAIPDGGPNRGKHLLGIYRLEGDRLTICMADPGKPRPTAFEAGKGSGRTLMTFRKKPSRAAPKR